MNFKTEENRRLIEEIKEIVNQEKNILVEIKRLYGIKHLENENTIPIQIKDLSENLKKLNQRLEYTFKEIIIPKQIFQGFFGTRETLKKLKEKNIEPNELEKETLKRLKEKKIIKKEEKSKTNNFANAANSLFMNSSKKLIKKGYFKNLQNDLNRSNLKYTLNAYVSIIFFSTFLALAGGIIIFLFFLFFNLVATVPFITLAENTSSRLLGLIWILFVFPIGAFILAYTYPGVERKSSEASINYELPFATINMAAIAGSMINPLKIFEIIISSKEFPNVKKELIKLMNEINIYGYDIVEALRKTANTTPSKKMSELLKGLATTINSGGDLTKFFDTRAESLLFEYKINREKESKAAETFMDLYISIVIAAPMIFLLLLMMMKISGLGITLPTSTITLIMVLGVTMINIFFILFLHFKKKG